MSYLAAVCAIAIPIALVVALTIAQLPLLAGKGSRDEFPGRRQGGGGWGHVEPCRKDDEETC